MADNNEDNHNLNTSGPKFTIILVLFSILVILAFVLPSKIKEYNNKQDIKQTNELLAKLKKLNTPKLELQSWRCYEESGYKHVVGEVKNISDDPLYRVQVVGVFRAENGDFIKSSDALIEYDPVMPNQISPFKTLTKFNPLMSSCEISFSKLGGGKINFTKKDK